MTIPIYSILFSNTLGNISWKETTDQRSELSILLFYICFAFLYSTPSSDSLFYGTTLDLWLVISILIVVIEQFPSRLKSSIMEGSSLKYRMLERGWSNQMFQEEVKHSILIGKYLKFRK